MCVCVCVLPLKLLPELGQTGEGAPCGRSTGANALFCLAEEEEVGKEEKGSKEEEEPDPGTPGLEGITVTRKTSQLEY